MKKTTAFLAALGVSSSLSTSALAQYTPQQEAALQRNGTESTRIVNAEDFRTHLWSPSGRGPLANGILEIPQGVQDVDFSKYASLKEGTTTVFRIVSPEVIIDTWKNDVNGIKDSAIRKNGLKNILETKKGLEGSFKLYLEEDFLAYGCEALADRTLQVEEQNDLDKGLYGFKGETYTISADGKRSRNPVEAIYGLFAITDDTRPVKTEIRTEVRTLIERIHTQETNYISSRYFENGWRAGADFDTRFNMWRLIAGYETENWTFEGLFTPNVSRGETEYVEENGQIMNRSKTTTPEKTFGTGARVGLKLDDKVRVFAGADALKKSQSTISETWENGDQDHNATVIEGETIGLGGHLGLGYNLGNVELSGGVNFHPDSSPSYLIGGGVRFGAGYRGGEKTTTTTTTTTRSSPHRNYQKHSHRGGN